MTADAGGKKSDSKGVVRDSTDGLPSSKTVKEIQEWLVNYIASTLKMKPSEIDVATSLDRYGLDSAAAVGLTGDLEHWLGQNVDPTMLYDYPTIESAARFLAARFLDGSEAVS